MSLVEQKEQSSSNLVPVVDVLESNYSVRRLQPNTVPTVTLDSSTVSSIEIPSGVFNLSRSTLSFNLLFPAEAGRYTFVQSEKLPFSMIRLLSDGQEVIAYRDIDIAQMGIQRAYVSMEEYAAKSKFDSRKTTHANNPSQGEPGAPSTQTWKYNSVDTDIPMGDLNINLGNTSYRSIRHHPDQALIATKSGILVNSQTSNNPLQKYVTSDNVNNTLSVKYNIPLASLKQTLFSLDKDLYHNKRITMELTLSPSNNYSYTRTQTGVVAGVLGADAAATRFHQAVSPAWLTAPAAPAAAPTISLMRLNLHVQNNEAQRAMTILKYNSNELLVYAGYWAQLRTERVAGGGEFESQLTVQPANGRKLRAIMSWTSNGLLNSLDANSYNRLGVAWTAHSMQLNGDEVYNGAVTSANDELWSYLAHLFKGSCTSGMSSFNEIRPLSVKDFVGVQPLHRQTDADHNGASMGQPMSGEMIVNSRFTLTGGAANIHLLPIQEVALTFSPEGIFKA